MLLPVDSRGRRINNANLDCGQYLPDGYFALGIGQAKQYLADTAKVAA